ncbi:histone H1-delta-like [Gigantopelta aegis]|uniref:histone H1-delta-like n=1 Tax=Gigantopelta aegis TaxID=1735272 RepID=UPI001B88C66C|nr:histone H1-delta-like [Gigantopelta aegis]
MTDVATVPPTKSKMPKKISKSKKPAVHPNYCDMVKGAISALKERGGSSRQAILSYICKNYKVADEKTVNSHLKLALRAGVKNNALKHAKGTGAAGSFKLGDEKESKSNKSKVPKVKKMKAAKPKKVIKLKSAKAKFPKPSSPKKLKIKKSSKKVSKKVVKTSKPKKIIKKVKTPKKMAKK